jgi:hypothetical protein
MSVFAAIAIIVGWGLAPGLAVASVTIGAMRDPQRDPERFVALTLGAGFSIWTLGARFVSGLGVLDGPVAWTGAITLTVVSIVVLAIPGRTACRDFLGRPARNFVYWAIGVGVTTIPVLRWILVNRNTFVNPTPWYYADLVRQTVRANGLPSFSYEWGRKVTFLDDYPGFTAGTGLATAAGHVSSLAAEHVITILVLIATALSVFLLARALGAARFGSLIGTVVLLNTAVFGLKLLAFRPEALGYPLAFIVLVVGAVTFAALGQVHGIDWTLSALLMAATLVVLVVVGGSGTKTIRRAFAFLLAATLAWGLVAGVWGSGFSGSSKVDGLPSISHGADPTWEFFSLTSRGTTAGLPPTARKLAEQSLSLGFFGLTWEWSAAVAALAVLVLAFAALRGRPITRTRARRALFFVLLAFGFMAVASALVTLRWETYVPRRTGFGRVLQLWPVLLAVAIAGAVSAAVDMTRGRWQQGLRVLSVVGAVALCVHGLDSLAVVSAQHPPAGQTRALRKLGVPPHALVLANSYTESYPWVAAGVQPVLNGRAPYTERHLLRRANNLIRDSRAFFAAPSGPLPCSGITHVIVVTDTQWRLATPYVFPSDVAAFDAAPDMHLVKADAGMRLYSVRPSHPAVRRTCVRGNGGY